MPLQPYFPVVSDVLHGIEIPFESPELQKVGHQILAFMNPDLKMSVTRDWPLARFDHVVLISVLYLAWVLLAPPVIKLLFPSKRVEQETPKGLSVVQKFGREPILLVQAVYNLAQVALCAYMMSGALAEYQRKGYRPVCNEFNEREAGMALVLWVFYTSKILDFFDTIFMVLRGKWRQLSFLHVYHHTSIFLFYWVNLNVGYDGDIYYTVLVNAFIHLVMYGYYFLTSLNVPVPKPIKMLVTNMQLIQFVTMMSQAVFILVMGCPYPTRITACYLGYIFSLFLLFSDFKRKTYTSSKEKGTKKNVKAKAN